MFFGGFGGTGGFFALALVAEAAGIATYTLAGGSRPADADIPLNVMESKSLLSDEQPNSKGCGLRSDSASEQQQLLGTCPSYLSGPSLSACSSSVGNSPDLQHAGLMARLATTVVEAVASPGAVYRRISGGGEARATMPAGSRCSPVQDGMELPGFQDYRHHETHAMAAATAISSAAIATAAAAIAASAPPAHPPRAQLFFSNTLDPAHGSVVGGSVYATNAHPKAGQEGGQELEPSGRSHLVLGMQDVIVGPGATVTLADHATEHR